MSELSTDYKTDVGRTSAIGTARFAHEFLSAAMHEHARAQHPTDSDISSAPGLYLMGHGIELSLKAFLLSRGVTVRELRKLGPNGHDLMAAFNAAVSRGLDRHLCYERELAAIELLNDSYSLKEFEYIVTGATSWPRFTVLTAAALKLFNAVATSVGYDEKLVALAPD